MREARLFVGPQKKRITRGRLLCSSLTVCGQLLCTTQTLKKAGDHSILRGCCVIVLVRKCYCVIVLLWSLWSLRGRCDRSALHQVTWGTPPAYTSTLSIPTFPAEEFEDCTHGFALALSAANRRCALDIVMPSPHAISEIFEAYDFKPQIRSDVAALPYTPALPPTEAAIQTCIAMFCFAVYEGFILPR